VGRLGAPTHTASRVCSCQVAYRFRRPDAGEWQVTGKWVLRLASGERVHAGPSTRAASPSDTGEVALPAGDADGDGGLRPHSRVLVVEVDRATDAATGGFLDEPRSRPVMDLWDF